MFFNNRKKENDTLALTPNTEVKSGKTPSTEFMRVIEGLPLNVMLCDPQTLEITYANSTSIETLRTLEEYLPIKAEDLVGSCIDIFHKNPAHQRALLANSDNLPHSARINVGPEILDLLVNPIFDESQNYIYAALSWSIITDKVKTEAATARLTQMIDKMPINAMMCDPKTFVITYANETHQYRFPPADPLLSVNIFPMCEGY